MIPKILHMTYKTKPPAYVFERWKNLNPNYEIDFSLDSDCIYFLKEYFSEDVANMFAKIPKGMYKADLWRLCKLYVYGGVYADVDLVPYVSIDTLLKDNYTFYSCLSIDLQAIFQAFIITTPNNPLILSFIYSFLQNKPYLYSNGPTIDMHNCIKFNIDSMNIASENVYNINKVKIIVDIGSSETNIKEINLYNFFNNQACNFEIQLNPYKDTFKCNIIDNKLIVQRTDTNTGWGYNHKVIITVASNQTIYLFKENIGANNSWQTSYVTWNGNKIFDSRYLEFLQHNITNTPWQ